MEVWGGNVATETAVSSPGIDAFVYARPYHGNATSGDVHYLSLCGSGKIGRFVIADVAGHGDEAGATALTLRGLMRRYINTVNQAKFVRALNKEFLAHSSQGRFATALLATYYAPTDDLIVCNAGHPRPLYYSVATGTWQALDHQGGANEAGGNLPLGIIEPTNYAQYAVPLAKGDLVVMHTDSLTEAHAPGSKEMLGEAGLLDVLRSLDATRPDTLAGAILDAVRARSAGAEPDDDVTILVLHHNAGGRNRYTVRERARTIARMMGLA